MTATASVWVAAIAALLAACGVVLAALIGARTQRANGSADRGLRSLESALDDLEARYTRVVERADRQDEVIERQRADRLIAEDALLTVRRELAEMRVDLGRSVLRADEAHAESLRVAGELGTLRGNETKLHLANDTLQRRFDAANVRISELEERLARYEASDGTRIETVTLTASTTTSRAPGADAAAADGYAEGTAPPQEER